MYNGLKSKAVKHETSQLPSDGLIMKRKSNELVA